MKKFFALMLAAMMIAACFANASAIDGLSYDPSLNPSYSPSGPINSPVVPYVPDEEASERHDNEVIRQQTALGNVYGSPSWVRQLYLNYRSLNLRVYNQDWSVELFRQNLSWNGTGTPKTLTLRVNHDDATQNMVGMDQHALEYLVLCEIETIVLTAKDGTVAAVWTVEELLAMREQFGLDERDELVVYADGSNPVKRTEAGEVVELVVEEPVEATASEATASEAQ